jgi:hypothetical protein
LLSPGGVVAHIGVVLVGSTILVLANAIGSPRTLWVWRPILILGALLALHAIAIRAAGRTSRLRVVVAWAGAVGKRLDASWSAWASGTLGPTVQSLRRDWEQHRQRPQAHGDQGGPSPAPFATAPAAWPSPPLPVAAYDTWATPPAAPAVAPAQPAATWPEPPPAWAAGWPTPQAAPVTPIRPTGYDTVLNGAQMANPDNPQWDQLEVAASMWLAHRNGDAPAEAAQ